MNTAPPTTADKLWHYYKTYHAENISLPGAEIMNPYDNPEAAAAAKEFFYKFYNDTDERILVIGINPGRFGGGITGVPFTDPEALRKFCGIQNNLGNRRELSSEFIYKTAEAAGGAEKFYSKIVLSAIFPLTLIRDGKNFNYYDDKNLLKMLLPELKKSLITHAGFNVTRKKVISLGKKNRDVIAGLNDELKLFERVDYIEHPRFIMQYKRKQADEFAARYLSCFKPEG